jgi:hypothetical protein
VAHSAERTTIPDYKVQQYIGKAKNAGGSAAFVDTEDSTVVCVVELDTPMGDYLIVGRLINAVAVADWTRVQNYVGGPDHGAGLWIASLASGFLVVLIVAIWWAATRVSQRGRAQDGLGRGGDQL